jgi:NitT/TauT family transport system substrate-binding protein
VPEQAGFFKENGLKVDASFNNGAATGVAEVAAGKAQFGTASPEAVWNAIEAGAKLTAFGEMVTKNIYWTGVLPNSPIKSNADLKGKKIGVRNLTSGAYPSAQESIAQYGIKASDVTFVSVGTGGQAAQALRSGQVDALVTSDTDWAIINQVGVQTRALPRSTAQGLPADVLYTTTAYYDAHKDICAAMGRAIQEANVFAFAQPDKAIDYYAKEFPDAAKAASTADNKATLLARLNSHALVDSQNGKWGWLELDKYNQLQDLDVQYGVSKQKLDLSTFMTNDLNAQMNKFDAQKVKSS